MEKTIKQKLLESIGKIYEESKDCELQESFFTKIDHELTVLADYFHTTKNQSFFIALVISLNFQGDSVDFRDLIRHFDCNPMKMLEFSDDFDYLCATGIFRRQKTKSRMEISLYNDQFFMHEKITDAILQSQPLPDIKTESFPDFIQFLEKIYDLATQRDEEDISTYELFRQTKELLSTNVHLPFIKKIEPFKLDIEDAYFFLYIIWKSISGSVSTDIGVALEDIFDNATKRVKYMQRILSGENALVSYNLTEIVQAYFFNDTEMKLTDQSCNLLKECGINLFANKKKKGNIISPDEIPFRELIFSKSEMDQLFLLKDLLDDTKLDATQKRLTERNLPKGITALLHGNPGTGKTEIVKQIAKETSRELMKVEISQSKSMWFGESEKIIKRIFTDYKSFAKECDRTPILLFNEADAIFSKRREVGTSGTDQTQNAIQNILLEELEEFDGILIATTNLVNNLDSAFERRFLFKIPFRKPDISVRAKIWMSKLPFLSLQNCTLLAEKFDFTGGQIENIHRKYEIHEIIYGEQVTINDIMAFCSEETIVTKRGKIGFNKYQLTG